MKPRKEGVKSCVEVVAEQSLMYTLAHVNTKRQGDSDGQRAEWRAFVLDFLSSRMQHSTSIYVYQCTVMAITLCLNLI